MSKPTWALRLEYFEGPTEDLCITECDALFVGDTFYLLFLKGRHIRTVPRNNVRTIRANPSVGVEVIQTERPKRSTTAYLYLYRAARTLGLSEDQSRVFAKSNMSQISAPMTCPNSVNDNV